MMHEARGRRHERRMWTVSGRRATLLLSFLVPLASFLASCGPSQKNTDVRMWTDSLAFRISTDPMPPRSR